MNVTRKTIILSVMLLAGSHWALAQSAICDDLKEAKSRTYGFRPSELNKEQRSEKIEQLDDFWRKAESMGPEAVPCLREMLQSDRNDPYFLFDVSWLLFKLDQSDTSKETISQAVRYTDLGDLDPAEYIRFLMLLSREGIDIGPLAEKYLMYPEVDCYLTKHGAMKLDRISGAVLLYGTMPEALAEKYLIEALSAEEVYVRSTAFFVLGLSMTEGSFKALQSNAACLIELPSGPQWKIVKVRKYSHVSVKPKVPFTRERVLSRLNAVIKADFEKIDRQNPPWVAGVEGFLDSAVATLQVEDIPLVREARRKSLSGVSDEALYEYFAWTDVLLSLVNRYDLYKEFRIH